jgi:phage shock protein E
VGFLSLLGIGTGKIKDALRKGAVIIDVRTPNEFDRGRVPESINIPIDRISVNAERIKAMKRPVILCCNSGARSGAAMQLLKAKGVKEVYNGGSWENVLRIIAKL